MTVPKTTMCKEAVVAETNTTSLTPIPIDRQWISKLLRKYPNLNARNKDKALIVAPMVDQSDLPFRMLCRRYGANLCYTPMIHSKLVLTSKAYREKFTGTWIESDRPLIAQLCGSDPDAMLEAARLVEPFVDGIDINCGCPQGIAKRGDYGAFLLEQEEKLLTLVKHLVKHLRVPLTAKVRLLPDPETNPHKLNDPSHVPFDTPAASLALYGKLVDAGIHLLTIHGRTRKQKQDLTGHSDWETIQKAVELYGDKIPIFANGSIETYDDVEECLKKTNCDGVMSSESLLEYPPIFYKIPQIPTRTIGRLQLAREYVDLAKDYPPKRVARAVASNASVSICIDFCTRIFRTMSTFEKRLSATRPWRSWKNRYKFAPKSTPRTIMWWKTRAFRGIGDTVTPRFSGTLELQVVALRRTTKTTKK